MKISIYRSTVKLVIAICAVQLCTAATPVKKIVPDYIGDKLELAVTPTPQHAAMKDDMLTIGPISIHMPPGEYGGPTTIKKQIETLLGDSKGSTPTRLLIGNASRNPTVAKVLKKANISISLKDKGDEAYHLYIGDDPEKAGGTVIVLAGNTPVADFWALQTLRQLLAEKNGVRYVQRGLISDWPQFPKRGNKRPKVWEHRFKANYAWFSVAHKQQFRNVFRTKGAAIRHFKSINPASSKWMDEIKAWARKSFDAGKREFVFKYDDTGYGMAEATRKKYKDNYFAAQQAFLTEMFKTIKSWDPNVDVFFMPQPYWTNAHDIIEYGAGLKEAGGLPVGLGMSFCGQEVIPTNISLGSVELAQKTLGFSGHKAQIYENYSRGGDFFAYHGRDPHLTELVECIFPERGTPVTRITVYDYLWNPVAYNPERSLKLACRELAGRDPARYKALYDYVVAWNSMRDKASFMPMKEARKQMMDSTSKLRAEYDKLCPQLEGSALAKTTGLAKSFLEGENWGESAALKMREKFVPLMSKHGYREGTAQSTKETITIDGNLNEPAWKNAKSLGKFVGFKQMKSEKNPLAPIVPEKDQTEVRILYDDTYLYIGALLHHSKPPKLPKWGLKKKEGERANLAWRVPNIELMIDPNFDRDSYLQIALNLQGWYSEVHYGGFGSKIGTGPWWKSNLKFKVTVGDKQSFIEVRIPFSSLGGKPKPGDKWGFQIGRNLNGYSNWSYMYEFDGFRHPLHFGTLIFERDVK